MTLYLKPPRIFEPSFWLELSAETIRVWLDTRYPEGTPALRSPLLTERVKHLTPADQTIARSLINLKEWLAKHRPDDVTQGE